MARKKKRDEVLANLLTAATPQVLTALILQLAADPAVRCRCLDYLERHAPLSSEQKKTSAGESVMALWAELLPDLAEQDEYGGGDYAACDQVSWQLQQIEKKLAGGQVGAHYRRRLLDQVLPFIESANAGLDDELHGVAHAACYDDADLLRLAQAFEQMRGDWRHNQAMRLYRDLGESEKYLTLRKRHLANGPDYHDLATFYWKAGDKAQALKVAEEGLRRGKGRMDELRAFVAKQAAKSGDRERYLALQFEQAMERITLDSYKAFRKLCKADEWRRYEPLVLERMKKAWQTEQLRIHMHRKEPEQAVALLGGMRYPWNAWESDHELRIARKLEPLFPEQILKFYLTGLGNLKSNATRNEYARQAKVMAKVRHMLVEVMGDEPRWRQFAGPVKRNNLKRPAFQQEFAKAVPGWAALE